MSREITDVEVRRTLAKICEPREAPKPLREAEAAKPVKPAKTPKPPVAVA